MKQAPALRDGTADVAPRKPPPRRLPKWLDSKQLEAVARSRCLMLLSVLSGESSVSQAIRTTSISRATYYQLETRALRAMLAVLNPHAENASLTPLAAAQSRIARLERQVQCLEQEKRRTQRLLLLTRKSMRTPLTRGRQGPWPKRPPSRTPMSPGASSP